MTGRREDISVISFINLVQNHPCIWNYSIAAYGKADETSAAWREIAIEIKDTEKNCRERWKNIRTAYVRSLKPPKPGSSQGSKKSYYLTEHLAFLHPFLKLGDTSGYFQFDEVNAEDSIPYQNDTIVKEEVPVDACSVQVVERPVPKTFNQTHQRRKRGPQNDILEWKKMRKSVPNTDQDSDQQFLLSLLPDLKDLSVRGKRTFKIATMSLLYRLLEEDEQEILEPNISVASSPSGWSQSSVHGEQMIGIHEEQC